MFLPSSTTKSGIAKFWLGGFSSFGKNILFEQKKRERRAKLAKRCVSDFRPTFSSPAIWLISSHIPVTVFPAHSSDRWKRKASLAQLGAGFIQPFAGGTAMAGRAAKGSPNETGKPSGFPLNVGTRP